MPVFKYLHLNELARTRCSLLLLSEPRGKQQLRNQLQRLQNGGYFWLKSLLNHGQRGDQFRLLSGKIVRVQRDFERKLHPLWNDSFFDENIRAQFPIFEKITHSAEGAGVI